MNKTDAEQAASALEQVKQRQEQVIDRLLVPRWYWLIVAVGMVAVGAVADTGQRAYIVPAAFIYALAVAGLSLWIMLGAARAKLHSELLGAQGAVAIVAFVYVVVGVSLAVAFALKAWGFTHPGAAGTVAGAVLLVIGGPVLMAVLRRVMLAKRIGADA
jgi:hypothetical protein